MSNEIRKLIAESLARNQQHAAHVADGEMWHWLTEFLLRDLASHGYEIKSKAQGQVIFRCDGCGREEAGSFNRMGDAAKPSKWYQRSDDDGTQLACSRPCIDRIAEASGKTRVVRPV